MKGAAGIISIVLILGVVIAAGYLMTTNDVIQASLVPAASITCSGFNDLSLSSVDYISNDPEMNKNVWSLTVAQNCQGSSAVGTINSEDIRDPFTGEEAQYDFKISTSVNSQKCEYDIRQANDDIWNMDYTFQNGFGSFWYPAFESECKAKSNFYAAKLQPVGLGFYDAFCFVTNKDAERGDILTPSLIFSSNVNVQAGGKTETTTITNSGGQSTANLGSIGSVSWLGNLVTGEQCPIASTEGISAIYYNGQWRQVEKATLDRYLSKRNTITSCLMGTTTKDGVDVCVDDLNSKHNQAINDQEQLRSTAGIASTIGTLSTGKVVLEMPKIIQIPLLKFKIDAAWLGIVTEVGKPNILSAVTNPVATGETGTITTVVRNDGTGDGAFEVYAQCDNPFSQVGSNSFINVPAGQTKTAYTTVSSSCSETTNAFCTVYARDRNNPSNQDSQLVSMQCLPLIVCQEGQTRCNGKDIQVCTGSTWAVQQTCPETCYETLAGAACVDEGSNLPPTFLNPLQALSDAFANLFGGGSIWDGIVAFAVRYLVAVMIVIGVVLAVSIPLPFIRKLMLSPLGLLMILIGALVLTLMFSVPIGNIAASITGGRA